VLQKAGNLQRTNPAFWSHQALNATASGVVERLLSVGERCEIKFACDFSAVLFGFGLVETGLCWALARHWQAQGNQKKPYYEHNFRSHYLLGDEGEGQAQS